MLRNAQYIEDHNIIFDNENSFKVGKKAQNGWDCSVKKIFRGTHPGLVLKTKTIVTPYLEIPSKTITYPYTDLVGEKIEFEGWFLPKGSYIIELNEGCQFGPNDVGYYIMRSSLNRNFVTIHSALWDNGYTTQDGDKIYSPTLRLTVDTEAGFYLEKDARVAQLIVATGEDTVSYGGEGSQFQGGRKTSSK
jgi:deoxycytidine triphosphate deaminase